MNIEVELSDLVERKADSKGRIAIGPEYAGKNVAVAIVEVEDED